MKAIGYIRVSTDMQADKGTSLENQIACIKDFAESKNYELINIYEDAGFSGKNTNRPGFQSMFEYIRNNKIDAVIVWHSTRFARNLKDNITYLDELEKRKVKFYSVQEPMMSGSSGKAMRNLMAVFAEYQSDVTGEHTRSVKANLKKNKQVYCAFPPLGFKNENGKLVRDPNTYQIVDRIFVYRKQGMSMHTIARMLNLRDEKGAKGGKFYASTIQKILNNSIYDNRN